MSKFDDIKELLSNAFPKFPNILQIELRAEFSVIDYKGQSFIIVSIDFDDNTFILKINGVETIIHGFDSSKLFNIIHATGVAFIPIDGKQGLLGFGDSHCDFVFFDESYFCFVEFKLNATSLKKVNKNRVDAIRQLKNTIDLFDDKLERNYAGLNLEAYVCTPEFYPRLNASWQALAQDFLEDYGIPLFERNDKTCK
ncbi:MAG: hypothetical protein ACKO9I_17030 [Sphaerospermopsis kisseleviana]|uniref:Uncharacterized protein n=2 Tax=Sphaerospermopsis TaxID=752201 RepID=A0A480A464_9CYAN|nr:MULTISPECIES: hypothetical protein [Sphaerospermopsis]MBD2134433.1 hypothetical protein [Sphaerospermopsis sp. FACHB-1094]MDB9442512.1 hypothetical protein [Sphaerospermopsis kisseleviana CS-549]BAZ83195.1 hypothetical protein NIES73_44820 [Sphaerospermopsis kisseleviana NIES-73]GCL36994.1 hypothetical protein SR1949_21000 [Sphaerospermopsis reniformis]